jgi:hypothetical protein
MIEKARIPSTLEWAKDNGRPFHWSCALDNYEPTRNYGHGRGWEYDRVDNNRGPGIILDTTGTTLGPNMVALVDDGLSVRPFYVAGWLTTELYFHPFPTNVDSAGTPILRADDGRPVDYSNWMVGPSKVFHLKISFESAE